MNPSETGAVVPTPEQDQPTMPNTPKVEAGSLPTSTLAEDAMPLDTSSASPDTMDPSNHMEATHPTAEDQPGPEKQKGFVSRLFEKIKNAFNGDTRESKIPADVVNTGPSASAGMPSAEHETRVAELSRIGDEKKADNQAAVVWGGQRNETNARLRSVGDNTSSVDTLSSTDSTKSPDMVANTMPVAEDNLERGKNKAA